MLDKETDARFIGYGAMVAESLVGVLRADCCLFHVSRRLFRHQHEPRKSSASCISPR